MIGLVLLVVIQLSVPVDYVFGTNLLLFPFIPLTPHYIHTKGYGLDGYTSIPNLGMRLALVKQTFAEMKQARLRKVYGC